jgi:hypothetical protein
MASLLLGAAGSALGGALLGDATVLGLTGAQIGGALGALAGGRIDAALTPGRHVEGPRLSDVSLQGGAEGAPVPRVYGRVRLTGQVIWASRFKESAGTTTAGGKGGPGVSETDYSYSISFALGLCEGVCARIGRVWANGALLDLSRFTWRFHAGGETQSPDPAMVEIEGAENAPAYRGLCHVVFEDMPLADFGNRIPQLQFEIFRTIPGEDDLEARLTAVALIPGAGEFVYATAGVAADDGEGGTVWQNVHGATGEADLIASLDDLQALAPNLDSVSLVVGWFGDDLRAGETAIRPGVETADKTTWPEEWSVAGLTRLEARLVSQAGGRPAYGGTPSDAAVTAAIAELKRRGLRVVFCPFLFMDIAPGNGLADPHGGSEQAAYPWRGRIVPASADQTEAVADEIAAFFSGTWGWRRMVLHYAQLCADAGGVEDFLIGSELRGLTRARSDAATYPAVAALKTLAADVRAIVGSGTRISYGADWSEYAGHQTGDAPGAFRFHLDPLWADANIDFIGIDNYLPLSDWRDGPAHLDAAIAPSSYDANYLAGNIRGGEYHDWYYASEADRGAQIRTPITDGLSKPWLWRAKDLWGWWSNLHYDRPDGSESATPTAWVPQAKPIVFTELGCPAIDKGANQPNVFYDPKSSESALPYFSGGGRDDLIQRRFLETHLAFWADAANNPVSTLYGAPMVERGHAWCWDARPFPWFPALSEVWGDAANWQYGHWLNGRLGAVTLARLVADLCAAVPCDVSGLDGLITGYAVTDTMSPREALSPLMTAFAFDAVESEGVIRFVMRGRAAAASVAEQDLAWPDGAAQGHSLVRAQESDLPQASRIAYIDGAGDYEAGSVEARRLVGASLRVASSGLPLVMDEGQAAAMAARLLQDAWVMRETAALALPPSRLALDAADEVLLTAGGRQARLRLTAIADAGARTVEAVATDPSLYAVSGPAERPQLRQRLTPPGRVTLLFLDLPWLRAGQNTAAPFVAAHADPWPGAVAVMRSGSGDNYGLEATLTRACRFGLTMEDFWSGPAGHWDRVNALTLRMVAGTLASASEAAVLGGANALAIENADGGWEILQFVTATLTGLREYVLTQLRRGLRGSETQMRRPVAAGARVVVLDGALAQLTLGAGAARLPFTTAGDRRRGPSRMLPGRRRNAVSRRRR